MKNRLFLLLATLGLFAACNNAQNSNNVSVTISPQGVGQPVNVAVTAVFAMNVAPPADWSAAFTLQKNGGGPLLCTSVTYDNYMTTATCEHANLEPNTNYTINLMGLSIVQNTQVTFTTVSLVTVSSVSKTSVSTVENGAMQLAYTFNSAVAAAPTLQVTSPTAETNVTQACSLSSDNLTYTCTLNGLEGCMSYTDYTATLSGTVIENTFQFNSSDDEFDSSGTLANCYTEQIIGDADAQTTGGQLVMTASYGGGDMTEVLLYKERTEGIAFTTYFASFERTAGTTVAGTATLVNALWNGDAVRSKYTSGVYSSTNSGWFAAYTDDNIQESLIPNADPESMPPFYICTTWINGQIRYYTSFDGETYGAFTGADATCSPTGEVSCTVIPSDFTSLSYPDLKVLFWQTSNQQQTDTTFTGKLNYIRYRSYGLEGTSADCPSLDID